MQRRHSWFFQDDLNFIVVLTNALANVISKSTVLATGGTKGKVAVQIWNPEIEAGVMHCPFCQGSARKGSPSGGTAQTAAQ